MGRIDTESNDPHEAYTGNSMGRKEGRTLLKQFSLVTADAGGDAVEKAEANTERIDNMSLQGLLWHRLYGEILEGLPGSKSMARGKRNVRNLGGPCASC